MRSPNLSTIELVDQSQCFKFKLVFIESAIRSMIQMGNMSESHVGDGLSSIMLSLVGEFENLQESFNCLVSNGDKSTTATRHEAMNPDSEQNR